MKAGEYFLHFRIRSFLGRGNFGDVFQAENVRDRRECALKIVQKGVGEEEEAKYQAEIYGAQLQAALDDPGGRVARVYDYAIDEASGCFFIEMEYVDGEDLATLVRRRQHVPPVEIARIGADLCGLLEWLGATQVLIDGQPVASIVHGDLKPRNVSVQNGSGKIKVLDFGIARALKETMVTMAFNSPAYTSPERLESGKADAQSDLWSTGVILYELMAGDPPFTAGNRELLERRIRSKEPPPPLPATYPEQLRRLIQRMLRHAPAERFASPADARKAFEDYLQGIETPFESDETVRAETGGHGSDPDPTIRVSQPTRKSAVPKSVDSQRKALLKMGAWGFVCFFVIWTLSSAFGAYTKSGTLAAELDKGHVADLDQAWKSYQEMEQSTWFTAFLWPLKRSLKRHLVASAEGIINEYRLSDAPTVYEKQWRQAAGHLTKALELDAGDNNAKAALRLAEGHLARIQTASSAARKDSQIRQRYANTAMQKFYEAAELRSKWPDPYLGLARLYTYETTDMDRATEALERAQRLGHQQGKREKAQLADGYRRMVERHVDESRKLREMPEQEKQLLGKARDHCQTAAQLYQDLGVYQNSVDNYKLLIKRCDEIEKRMAEMSRPFLTTP
jgi:serine/threonine protein kinase